MFILLHECDVSGLDRNSRLTDSFWCYLKGWEEVYILLKFGRPF